MRYYYSSRFFLCLQYKTIFIIYIVLIKIGESYKNNKANTQSIRNITRKQPKKIIYYIDEKRRKTVYDLPYIYYLKVIKSSEDQLRGRHCGRYRYIIYKNESSRLTRVFTHRIPKYIICVYRSHEKI